MKSIFASIALTLSLLASVAAAQVATGTPAFGSFGGGPFDTVNLGNLNVHFAIPVLHKAGRGIPFTYDLTYDSSVWTPVTSGGTTQWQPAIDWGWNIATAASSGYVTEDVTNSTIISHPCNIGETTYSNYVYHDPFGKQHVFVTSTSSPTPVTSWVRVNPCGHTTTYSGYVSGVAADGSGYAISAQYTSATVTARDGTLILDPMNSYTGSATATDANGNEVTANSSNQYFDTLSSSTPVLTVGGSGTTSSPNTFTYTAPSGASASYTMNYTQYTVSTNFGVSSISEYGPTSVPLVSSIVLPDSTSYSFTYEATSGSCTPLGGTSSCVTGRLASVTLPTGGTVNYSYSGGSASTGIYSDGSTGDLTRILSPSTSCGSGCWQYVRALLGSTAPGPGSAWTTTVTDPASNQTVLNFTEDSRTTSSSSVATYNMYETERQTYQGSSTLLATRVVCYNASYSSCGTSSSVNSPISQTDTYTELPSTSTRLSETVYNGSYTASGLVSDDREYDYGVSMTSAPGTTHLVEETVTSYASLGNGIVDHPSSVVVSDWTGGSAVTIASTSYTYDGTSVTATSGTPQHTSISGSRGNLTTLATQVNGSTTLYRTNSYYDTGNVYVSTDLSTSSGSPGPSTTYSYGSGSCGNSFPTSISEPLSLGRSTTWNCTGGVASQATDETTQSVSAGYSSDPYFWRPSSVTDQASNTISLTYTGQTSTESTLTFNSGNSVSDVLATLDGFGRPILSQVKQSPSATNYDSSQTAYNSLGQPYESTMPFSAAAGTTSGTAPYTTTTYDALGRVTNVQDANGGYVSYTYTNNDVVQTTSSTGSGAQSFSKQLEYDGLGRLSSVCEMSTTLPGVGTCGQSTSQTGYWTKYTYDALGHLLTVTQNAQASSPNQQTRSYAFDMIGRMTSESNPETSNSGANGTAYYTYDVASGSCSASAGNMTKRVDNAGNTTCYSYDSIHRVTNAGSSGTCRHFRYDTSATPPTGVTVSNTTAQMEEAYTDNCSTTLLTDEWFSYSVRGELTDVYEATPNSGGYYHTTAAYWPSGALETLSGIPSVPTINYGAAGTGLDGEGRYTAVSASGTNPVTGVTYSTTSTSNPLGSITGVTYGSSDSDSFAYDPNTGRETGYTFSVNGSNDAGTLAWNANGTLASLAIVDGISGTSDTQTCGFTYDDLARVGGQDVNGYSADCGTAWQQLFTYDAFGNLQKSGSLNFAASYAPASNQFTLSGATVTYDANGNLTNDNLNSYTWDPNWGTMQSANGLSAIYDALGRVVEQYNGSSYYQTLYSPVGRTAIMYGSSLSVAFVRLPGGGTAVYNSIALSFFRHSDWLGSSRLASTTSRTLYSSTAYAPFGEQYATSGTADGSFTGQDSNTVSSLYDFMARRQSPSQGRWVSPDPSGLAAVDPTSPQTWNRYAYVGNSPLDSVDPLGLNKFWPCESIVCTGGGSPGSIIDPTFSFGPLGSGSIWSTALNGNLPVVSGTATFTPLGYDVGDGFFPTDGSAYTIPLGVYATYTYSFVGWNSTTSISSNSGGGGSYRIAPNNQILPCFVKGAASGLVGSLVVGGVAAGAVALGVVSAPVATAVLAGAAVIGGGALLINSAINYAQGNSAGLAYNAGSLLGSALGGGIGARGVYGALSPGQTFPGLNLSSFTAEFGQLYKPSLGPPNLNFFGTGPTAFGAAGAPALAGSGASTIKKGGC